MVLERLISCECRFRDGSGTLFTIDLTNLDNYVK